MPWEVNLRPPVQPLQTLHSGEELNSTDEEPPKLYRSPSSLDRMLSRIGSDIIRARSIMRPWRYFWGQRHGEEMHESDDEDETLLSRDSVQRERRSSRRNREQPSTNTALMGSIAVLACIASSVPVLGVDGRIAVPSLLGLALLSIGVLARRCAGRWIDGPT